MHFVKCCFLLLKIPNREGASEVTGISNFGKNSFCKSACDELQLVYC